MSLLLKEITKIFIFTMCCILFFIGCRQQKYATIELTPGPHLLIDNFLIDDQSFLDRTVNNPRKLPQPVVTGGENGDQNFQPYMTILRDKTTGKFRMWYNTPEHKSQSHIGYIESEDGIHWIRPHRVLDDPDTVKFGVTVLDRGPEFEEKGKRYVLAYYFKDGLRLATSGDGLNWKTFTDTSVLKHNHDINSVHWDPLRKRYLAIVSVWHRNDAWNDNQRDPYMSVSDDLLHWKKPWQIISAKPGVPREEGETQFYAMSGVIARGELLIGLVKVLRDDMNATPGKTGKEMGDLDRKAAGLGYTVLAWSRDGETWMRDHQPFIPRNPVPGTWDHAMAWGDDQIVVGDETFIYYAGYARGHKVARFKERQIGLARMQRDRYVSLVADINPGHLVTKPLMLNASSLSINANVPGILKIRILDENYQPVSGYGWIEITGDSVAHPVQWSRGLSEISDKSVRLEFELTNGQLFGFDLIK